MSNVNLFTFHVFQTVFADIETRNTRVFLRIGRGKPGFDQFVAENDVRRPTRVRGVLFDRLAGMMKLV